MIPAPLVSLPRLRSDAGSLAAGERVVAEETPVAITYNGSTHAVMMATPADLPDFALGFSLNEGVIDHPREVRDLEIVAGDLGVELRLWLADSCRERYARRRRRLAGPVGCGLCGVESLEEAVRPAPSVAGGLALSADDVAAAMAAVPDLQWLNQEARAVHAAAFWTPGAPGAIRALREDVGRHNALDKLAGALVREGVATGEGAVLLTSRVSVELVQKTARLGAPVLIAVSAPTALAVRTAEACGLTLVAVARGRGFEVFTHPERVTGLNRATVDPRVGS